MVELDNLIDLSFDDNDNCLATGEKVSTHATSDGVLSTDWSKKILDGQKQDGLCDPFEITEKGSCAKEMKTNIGEQPVNVADLHSVEEGNLIDVDEERLTNNKTKNSNCKNNNMCTSATLDNIMDETAFDSPQFKNDSLNQKSLRKHHKSAFQTPDSRSVSKDTPTHVGTCDKSCTDIFAKESPQMIASESPLKFADDDLAFNSTDNNFEADMEMLNIPMLQTLCSKSTSTKHTDYRTQLLKLSLANATCQTPESHCHDTEKSGLIDGGNSYNFTKSPLQIDSDDPRLKKSTPIFENNDKDLRVLRTSTQMKPSFNEHWTPEDSPDSVPKVSISASDSCSNKTTPVSHMEGITSKFPSYHSEVNNNQRIHELLTELKTIIQDCVLNDEKRERANFVLETLQTCLPESAMLLSNANNLDAPPQSIVRQRTFDIELQASLDKEAQSKPVQCSTQDENELQIFKQPMNLLPNTVVVQDGDILQDTELNAIVKQAMLSLKNTVNSDAYSEDKTRSSDNGAPTVIVVMNPPPVPTQLSANDSFHENSMCNNSLDKTLLNQPRTDVVRRRSMSLSLHDKLKNPIHSTQGRRTETKIPQSSSKDTLNFSELKTPRRKSFSIASQKVLTSTTYRKGCEKLTIDLSKNINDLKPKHLRNSLAAGSITNSAGSFKATLPINKKATPIIKTTATSADRSMAHYNTLNVANSQSAQKPFTFTKGLNRTQCESSYPNACSTPTVKRHNFNNQNDASKTNAATTNSRQTLTKPKTPLKARY